MLIALIILVAREKNTPIRINGIPNPNEYASNKLKAMLGVVDAKVRMVPKIGPTQGVQPAANAKPNTKDNG